MMTHTDAQPFLAAAIDLLRQGDHDRARRLLEGLAQEAPQDTAVLNALGTALYEARDFAAAEDVLRRCLDVDPLHPVAHATLGELALHRKDAKAAARHLEVTLKSDPTGLEGIHEWAKALMLLAIELHDTGRSMGR
jgi:predicted Zn-dependent protease